MAQVCIEHAQIVADEAEEAVRKSLLNGLCIDGFPVDDYNPHNPGPFKYRCCMFDGVRCQYDRSQIYYTIGSAWDDSLDTHLTSEKFAQGVLETVQKHIARLCVDYCIKERRFAYEESLPYDKKILLWHTVPEKYVREQLYSNLTPVIAIGNDFDTRSIKIRKQMECFPDPALHRRRKHGYYGWMELSLVIGPSSDIVLYMATKEEVDGFLDV